MRFHEQNIFPTGGRSNYRIPSLVVTKHGTLLAFCNDRLDSCSDHADEVRLVVRRKPLGGDWEPKQCLFSHAGWGCYIGSAVYDAETDEVFCSFTRSGAAMNEFRKYTDEERADILRRRQERAAADGIENGAFLMHSADDGRTWDERPHIIAPTVFEFEGRTVSACAWNHGSSAGIQLQSGPYRGRLLCPSRFAADTYYDWDGLRRCSFNNALYSDDHGRTWTSSQPVQHGTGEGTLMECGDGTILYNSRAYFFDGKRYLATSTDGGETWGDFRCDDFLTEEHGGCNAALFRVSGEQLSDASFLPVGASAITLFSNPRSDRNQRENVSVSYSFDDGRTWAGVKQIYHGLSGYSSLTYSPAEGLFYLLYELGTENSVDRGLNIAAFDPTWLFT